jgi:tRNA threonylcarbamoyladenosine biosynthesis protein TsaB
VLVLAIETATDSVSVAVGEGARTLGEVRLDGSRRHAEQLVPAIRYLCHELDVELGRVAVIGVGRGPGLFTGLRVGVTTARVMAQALGVPVIGVPTLDLVAYPLRHSHRLVVTVLDARRREVFHARYRPVPGGIQRESEYLVSSPAELVAELDAGGEDLLLAGDGLSHHRDELAGLGRAEWAGPGFAAPRASTLVELTAARFEREEFDAPWDVHPLYLRESDAEIAWAPGGSTR